MNNVFSWGANASGQLGFPPPPELPRRVPADSAAIEEDVQRRAAEAERRAQAQLQLTPTPVTGLGARSTAQVACGENHTLVLDRLGYCWSFGRNREVRALWGRSMTQSSSHNNTAVYATWSAAELCVLSSHLLCLWFSRSRNVTVCGLW